MERVRKPKIGVWCGYDDAESGRFYVNAGYVRALEWAGASCVLLPAPVERDDLEPLLDGLNGLLLPGGYDLDPKWWGEELGPNSGRIVPECDAGEIALCQRAWVMSLPILGICRGVQSLNVALGGTLYQDLGSERPSFIAHRQKAPTWYPTHPVRVADGSRLAEHMLSMTRVNSFHHQAVRDVGEGLRAVAWAPDGVVEAVEGVCDAFVLGVQWHPELMWPRDAAYGEIFVRFVAACRGERT